MADDEVGTTKTLLGTAAVGTNRVTIDAGTAIASNTHLLVFVRSDLAEMTTPLSIHLTDNFQGREVQQARPNNKRTTDGIEVMMATHQTQRDAAGWTPQTITQYIINI